MFEIVTHCWKYPRLLMYHLSSLIKHPPKIKTQMVVYYEVEDKPTVQVLEFFSKLMPPTVTLIPKALSQPKLCRRAIGRDISARRTKADLVWFADADYWFGESALDNVFEKSMASKEILFYPRRVMVSTEQKFGDLLIKEASGDVKVLDLNPLNFHPRRQLGSIGGIQIVKGDICRKKGYLPPNRSVFKRYHVPSLIWERTVEDAVYRKYIGSLGTPVIADTVYRIRHSTRGGLDGVVEL